MLGQSLLRLYPRAWRDRYGEEFLAIVGHGALRPQLVIDIVSGAIDAWLSADVRRATRAGAVPSVGGSTMLKSLMACERSNARYTARDGLIGAGVMIGASLIFSILGIALRRNGWPMTGEVLTEVAFLASFTLSMPFWVMKGQPWKAQAVIVSTTLAVLVAITYFAAIT